MLGRLLERRPGRMPECQNMSDKMRETMPEDVYQTEREKYVRKRPVHMREDI